MRIVCLYWSGFTFLGRSSVSAMVAPSAGMSGTVSGSVHSVRVRCALSRWWRRLPSGLASAVFVSPVGPHSAESVNISLRSRLISCRASEPISDFGPERSQTPILVCFSFARQRP